MAESLKIFFPLDNGLKKKYKITQIGIKEDWSERADPVTVWKSQIEETRKNATGTREQRRDAVLDLQIISMGVEVLFSGEENHKTPEYQELKANILKTLDEISQAMTVEKTQKQPPRNWFSKLGF